MRNSQSPAIQSIYQNALHYYLDRADLFTLDQKEAAVGIQVIEDMLARRLNRQINASPAAADKLRHLYFESKNIERTQGPKTFGLGYPFFIETHGNDLIVAPLFVWYWGLEPSQNLVNSWIVRFESSHFCVPNYQLLQHLEEKYDIEIIDQYERLALSQRLNRDNLALLCEQLAERTGIENRKEPNDLAPSPGIDEIGILSERGTLYYNGILGLFPPQKHKKLPAPPKPEDAFMTRPLPPSDAHFNYFYLPADPYQASALEEASDHKISVVEGNPTSGKSHTLANFLINALANGEKCLVVSERVPTLVKSQQLLSRAGINQYNFLLKDALNDKPLLLEMLRVAGENVDRKIEYSPNDFDLKLQRYLREKNKLSANYRAVRERVFGDHDWTDTVGLFLSANRIEGKELLTSQLNAGEFDFTHHEYEIFKHAILTSRPLYQKVNTLKHPLTNLNEEIFLQKPRTEGLNFLKKNIRKFLNKAASLQHRYITKTDAYSLKLREHYERHYNRLLRRSTQLSEKIADYSKQYGADFNASGIGALKVLGLFSRHKKQIARAKEDVARDYAALERVFERGKYFEFHFLEAKDRQNIPKLTENLESFKNTLLYWQSKIETHVQEELMRLNSRNVHPDLDYKDQIAELEYALDLLIEEINEAKIYHRPIQNKALTIPQRQKYLESIIEQLENTELNLRDFDAFYDWQHNWLNLGLLAQKVIKALVKVKPNDWMAAFESWYFSNILTKKHNPGLPVSSEGFPNYAAAYHALKPLIFNRIGHIWQARQMEALKKLKRRNKRAWQLIFDKNSQKNAASLMLDHILEEGFEAVTAFLPVLFVTPYVARHVLPQIPDFFDYLIFDEGSRFAVENAAPIAPLGKRIVIFGGNDTYGMETSLIQYVRENGAPTSVLLNKYAQQAKFAGKASETPDQSAGLNLFPLEFHVENLEGRFDEKSGTNDVEAQQIIRLLNSIERTPQRTYPSVGIICFTVEQRDLISAYLLKIKQQNASGSEKIRQLERNGMGVFHVDELYGQHFDILMISFTIGTINFKGSLSKKSVFFNTPDGVSHIRLILNKVPRKIFLIHSIPEPYLKRFLSKPHDQGTFLLAVYLKFGEAVANGDLARQKELLPYIAPVEIQERHTSVFTGEVVRALTPYLDPGRLVQNVPLDKIHLPLTIQPLHGAGEPLIIHPDGFFAHARYTSFLWEFQQQMMIKNLGFVYHPVWSVKWWKNPKQEARKLASIIIKKDSQSGVMLPPKTQNQDNPEISSEPPSK
ncbi:MAG: hypothetical protein D6714_11480 [Bacteroidetes bacterium]|nr:MAG: hypothetical protein D6714_11480 [Bacteroidota bacterium]